TLTQHVTPISRPNTRYYDPNQPFPAPIFFFCPVPIYLHLQKKNFCPSHKTEEGSSCLTKLPKSTRDPNNLCPTTPSTIALRIPCSV
ncbi:hypothetical protein CGCVW01_v004281, partial [Colletotrichum viniferum]